MTITITGEFGTYQNDVKGFYGKNASRNYQDASITINKAVLYKVGSKSVELGKSASTPDSAAATEAIWSDLKDSESIPAIQWTPSDTLSVAKKGGPFKPAAYTNLQGFAQENIAIVNGDDAGATTYTKDAYAAYRQKYNRSLLDSMIADATGTVSGKTEEYKEKASTIALEKLQPAMDFVLGKLDEPYKSMISATLPAMLSAKLSPWLEKLSGLTGSTGSFLSPLMGIADKALEQWSKKEANTFFGVVDRNRDDSVDQVEEAAYLLYRDDPKGAIESALKQSKLSLSKDALSKIEKALEGVSSKLDGQITPDEQQLHVKLLTLFPQDALPSATTNTMSDVAGLALDQLSKQFRLKDKFKAS